MASPRLITIPISHFCEKARWALDRAGVDYREERHLQGIHIFHAKRLGGGITVPVLVTAEGAIDESREILAWADSRTEAERRLYPEGELGAEAAALESGFDAGLGPDGRLWMYFNTFPERDVVLRHNPAGVPRWERRMMPYALPVITPLINRRLGISPKTADAAYRSVHKAFDAVAERLSDGRRYLLGGRFTAADLSFAALSASLVWPEQYGSPLPAPDDVRAEFGDEIRAFREHPAGQFALRLFREDRRPGR